MLVLSRRQTETVVVNDNIVVTVLKVRGSLVRLGIDAPTEIPVHRGEVHKAIKNTETPRAVGRAG